MLYYIGKARASKNLPPIWHVNIARCCDSSCESRSRFPSIGVRDWGKKHISMKDHKSHAVIYMNLDGPRGREALLLRPLPNKKTCSTQKKQSHQAYSHHHMYYTKKLSVPVVVMVVLIGSHRQNNHFANGPSFLLARFLHGAGSSHDEAWLQHVHKKLATWYK